MAKAKSTPVTMRVDGLKELQAGLRKAERKGAINAIRKVNKSLAEQVASHAQPPVVSGKLAASVKALSGVREADIKAGGTGSVPYAAAIHWGWPSHNIKPNPFLYRALYKAMANEGFEKEYLEKLAKALEDDFGATGTPSRSG